MTTQRILYARTLVMHLPYCPTCGANGSRQVVTQ